MIRHYFIVAFRNLFKYRQQTIISIIGLAVGFVCFALSVYWIRYELDFDDFHADADRIYEVRQIDKTEAYQVDVNTPPPLAATLEKHFPELQATCANYRRYHFETGKDVPSVEGLEVDERFFDIFDVEFLEGSFDVNDDLGIFVTRKFALEYFQTDHPVGKEVIYYVGNEEHKRFRVRGVIKEWPKNTNLRFDLLKPIDMDDRANWGVPGATYVRIDKGIPLKGVLERMGQLKLHEAMNKPFTLVPLREVYYTEPVYRDDVSLKFDQVLLFAALGFLVVICSLFNYLNLYSSRIRMRTRELSLRKVNGASDLQVFGLLITEFSLLLLFAFVIGFIGIEWLLPSFKRFAGIESDRISIYGELLSYVWFLIFISLAGALAVVAYVRRQVFQESLRRVTARKSRGLFARTGLLLQMVISMGFIFCTVLYFKQIYTLDNSYSGVERENILSVMVENEETGWSNYMGEETVQVMTNALRSESSVEAVMPLSYGAIFPRMISTIHLAKVDENVKDEEAVQIDVFRVHPDYLSFYGLQLLAGNDFKPDVYSNRNDVILNEAAVLALGFTDPIGKIFYEEERPYYMPDGSIYKANYKIERRIIGVVKNFIYESPLVPVAPVMISCVDSYFSFAVKYRPGQLPEVKGAIERLVKEKVPGRRAVVRVMEQEYREKYESEASLRLLLALLSGVCVIVSLFGIYSMVSLSSEQRRKEMAVRKVNGASLMSIFGLFLKEYLLLLLVSVAIAFPAGYLIMKPWIEKFVLQTAVGAGLYVLIFLFVAAVIVLTVIGRVWHTAHVNPSSELKKE